MRVETIVVGAFQVNCYVVTADPRQALVIDPGAEADRIGAYLRSHRLAVGAHLVTHGHMDHCSALAALEKDFPAPVAMHPADAAWAFSDANRILPYYATPGRPTSIARALADGLRFSDAGLDYEVIATPGHTPGGVCFHFPAQRILFTGDTLFAASVGRTDLPGGDELQLARSLQRLRALPNDTVVYAGHGPRTTLAHEKRTNPFMQ